MGYTFFVNWTVSEIKKAFSGRLIGNQKMINAVCKTMLLLPDEIIKYITKNVWFISSPDDAWAFTLRGSDVEKQHLIVLSDQLFRQKDDQIKYTIIHEIGHVMLGHKNSVGRMQTQTEIKMQEIAADAFAKKYLGIATIQAK